MGVRRREQHEVRDNGALITEDPYDKLRTKAKSQFHTAPEE